MKKLLLLPITLPVGMARGALEGAVKTAAEALMDLARGDDARPTPTTPDVGATARAASAAGTAARASGAVPTPPPPPPPAPPPPPPAPPPTVAAEVVDLDDVRPAPGPATPSDVAEDLGLEVGHVSEEPAELVESEGAADPGAELHVDEPWPGYGRLKAPDVVDRVRASDAATKAIVRLYEQQHRKRRTVIAATES